jgi:acylphosphatase
MIRANISITGDVQTVGFRTFVKNLAESLHITGCIKNLDDSSVVVVCEGEKGTIEQLIGGTTENPPSFANVEDVSVEYVDYIGEFDSFERLGDDVPKKATLGDLLGVMKNFDMKAEKLVQILSDMNNTLKDVKDDTSQIKVDMSQIKVDTSQIKEIKENTVIIKDKLISLEEIHKEMLDLRMKYDQLSDDVAEIKIAISGLGTIVPA